ncbi:hypothetical protein C7999DRAFT_15325 [Corynascus novoguineensis]|uniref:Uncharacterized protein n=1 Tax=Corynascus novoguineensis TaxID=1126955 RepID=A0AAN7HEI7_9PEZI|nr:hypothetical protein C7999DRAFT_15325 [Corynascus novoguineensis]
MPEPFKEEGSVEHQTPMSNETELANDSERPTKRPAIDSDIEIISSNPVKKRRLSEPTTTQGSATSTTPPSLPPPLPPPSLPISFPPQETLSAEHETCASSQTTLADRCRSLCGIGQAEALTSEASMDTRGTSLPALEQFAFSQTPSLATRQTPRVSDAISPKQIPHAVPPPPPGTGASATESVQSMATATTTATMTTTASPLPKNSITLDQISCLDFNGVPTNSPGFDTGRVFGGDGDIPRGIGGGNATGAMAPDQGPHNSIPFTMSSAGNVMTISQAYNMGKQSVPVLSNGTRPPCLQCARIRQRNMLRQAQVAATSPMLPTQANGRANSQNNCHPPSSPRMPPPTSFPRSRQTPRSTPAPPSQEQRQPPNQQQTRYQQLLQNQSPSTSAVVTSNCHLQPLLRDMAQTIQASFPYVQVAARHGMTPARVAEVLASVVASPLLWKTG